MPSQLPTAENWVFQVSWCPQTPELLVTKYFDGTMGTHMLQSTNDCGVSHRSQLKPDDRGVFDILDFLAQRN